MRRVRAIRRLAAGPAFVLALAATAPRPAGAQAVPDGARLFEERCASCHRATASAPAPTTDELRARTPQAILDSLSTGAMRAQGSRLSGAERRAIAEFLGGQRLPGDATGAAAARCPAGMPSGEAWTGSWHAWSPTPSNTRFQPAGRASLSAQDVARLTLKWAFGFPDASAAWSHPTVAGGRVFVGSQNGTVYALDARAGCVHWTFAASGGVRTAIVWNGRSPGGAVYFGDTAAFAYALDADTGRPLWTRRVDDHPLARITGSPAWHEGRLYVPVSSYEESQGADPQYACCSFRGSVVALDAATGRVHWKTRTIEVEPAPRGTSSAGVTLLGPAGAAVWSPPTIDAARGALYVATGNLYAGPRQPGANAVIALDLRSGAVRWMRQTTADDVYLTGCRGANPNCPAENGPDFDFGSPPMLARAGARDLLVIGQKSGVAFAMDPDREGAIVWQYRAGRGGALGGLEWGAAADGDRAYFAVSDITHPQPGGLHAVELATGTRAWYAEPPPPICGSGRGCNAAQSAAVTAIPGIVFSGSNDGALRAYAAADGAILWQFDTNREFPAVNGVASRGGSMQGPGAAVAGGMVFVNSGYGAFGGRPGNVLLAFGPP